MSNRGLDEMGLRVIRVHGSIGHGVGVGWEHKMHWGGVGVKKVGHGIVWHGGGWWTGWGNRGWSKMGWGVIGVHGSIDHGVGVG